jgi:nitroreductase
MKPSSPVAQGHLTEENRSVRRNLTAVDAIKQRRSVRQFLATPVSEMLILDVLNIAARAASGMNIQPWQVHVVTGAARDRVSAAVLEKARDGRRCPEYEYLPAQMVEPHLSRRRKVGFELYELYGIGRGDKEGRKWAELRNFEFFGAPVGMFFVMDSYLTQGNWLDCGMFMQNVMIAAQEFGLQTCPQQAWCDYGEIVHSALGIPSSQIILSGMAMGYIDESARVNMLHSERVGANEFTVIHRG